MREKAAERFFFVVSSLLFSSLLFPSLPLSFLLGGFGSVLLLTYHWVGIGHKYTRKGK